MRFVKKGNLINKREREHTSASKDLTNKTTTSESAIER